MEGWTLTKLDCDAEKPENIELPTSGDDILDIFRMFCTKKDCIHYNNECTEGNETTWVDCPLVREHNADPITKKITSIYN